ncbi:Endoplasmin -like protein [Capsicum annuum]|nr:Endoplasmin -like protein [Capsicum annuum]
MEKLMADSKFSFVEWKMNVWKRIWLTELVKKYSEFIDFPIHLWASKEVEKEVPADEDESVDEDETSESSSSEEEVEEEDAEKADDEKKTKTKKVKETTYEWELLNDMKAIWLRNPKEVTDEEYTKFYHSLAEGLVDSDTLPLNDPRKMLQQHISLKTIKKKLIRKALDMIRKLAEENPDEINDKKKEDATNRNRLAKLLRFETSKSDGKLTSLDQYISRMKSGKKDIFYVTGASKEQLEKSPFLERLNKNDYEVIVFTDSVDEYHMQYLMDYEDKKFQNVFKEGLKLKDSKTKELKESFKPLTKWWKTTLASDNVEDVKISNRLADSPCVVVLTSKYGWSSFMEKIMRSQTQRSDENVKLRVKLIYQTALMESGFELSDPKDFASHIYSQLRAV